MKHKHALQNTPTPGESNSKESDNSLLLKRNHGSNETVPSDSEKDNVNRNGQRLTCTMEASKVDVKGWCMCKKGNACV